MSITILGAAGGEVTGSAYHLKTRDASVLFDFGLFQGSRQAEKNNRVLRGLPIKSLDAVVLTHAHLDHTGRLPLLVQNGFRGRIHATAATVELTHLILADSAHLQEGDAERINRKHLRQGKPLVKPLYTPAQVVELGPLFSLVELNKPFEPAPGVQVRMVEAGHMLGSTSIEVTAEEEGRRRVVVFSGDLGPRNMPLLPEYTPFARADLVFLESTYGDRDHRPLDATLAELQAILQQAVLRRGKILVPAFAIGRTQQILYHLAGIFHGGQVAPFPIYIDSPMAIKATALYARHPELLDDEARHLVQSGQLRRDLESVHPCPTAEDSRALNNKPGPCLIIAGAGMCNGGRIVHHLKHNLWRPETTVLIVGFQSDGSLGRQLVDGKAEVKIFGEKVAVGAAVHTLGGFSAHAGQTDLLHWLEPVAAVRPRVILTHGEDRARQPLAQRIKERFNLDAHLPKLGESVEL